MSEFVGNPVVALNLVGKGATYYMTIGTAIESMTIARPYEDEVVSGTIVGISLDRRNSRNAIGAIYDGIPTARYATDDIAGIHNAANYFKGYQIALETENGTMIIPISMIKAVSGTFESPDGTVTTSVDITNAEVSVNTILSETTDGSTLVLSEGEVAEEVTTVASVTVTGANAGIAQNHAQEV